MINQCNLKNEMTPSRSIAAVMVCSLLYWLYLAYSTQMQIVFDSLGYEELGRLLQTKGFIAYLQTGPNREPIYPLLVCWSMMLSACTSIAYTKIMALFGVLLLAATQWMLFVILRLLSIRNNIIAATLAYFALSPAINNSAFSLYSEISAIPFFCLIILVSYQYIQKPTIQWGALLGLTCAVTTLAKAVLEGVFPLFLAFCVVLICRNKMTFSKVIPGVCSALLLFYIPITGYKALNQHYNGHFTVTNRGPWALYGNTARRAEPLTWRRFGAALAYTPGEGVCARFFTPDECDFWSYKKSDELGFAKLNQLKETTGPSEIDATLVKLSLSKAAEHPLQYVLLTSLESIKMFFWESTQIGFVEYPQWLNAIYKNGLIKDGLRLTVGLLTIFAFFYCLRQFKGILIPSVVGLSALTIALYAFFFILTRYALPLAPLYLVLLAWSAQQILKVPHK